MTLKNNISVVDVAGLRDVEKHFKGYRAWIPGTNDLYKFNETSVLVDDGIEVLRPDNVLGTDAQNPGRWLKVRFAADDVTGIQPEVFENDVLKVATTEEFNFVGATVVDAGGGRATITIPPGISAFLGLSDTPGSFTGKALDLVRVNAGATALEFLDETSDFLTQYPLLAGRSGGQEWISGLDAGDDATITATANASAGDVIIKVNPSTVVARFLSTGRVTFGGTGTWAARLEIIEEASGRGFVLAEDAINFEQAAIEMFATTNDVRMRFRVFVGGSARRMLDFKFQEGENLNNTFFAEITGDSVQEDITCVIKTASIGGGQHNASFWVAANAKSAALGVISGGAKPENTGMLVMYRLTTGWFFGVEKEGSGTYQKLIFRQGGKNVGAWLTTGEFLVGRTTLILANSIAEFEKNQNAGTSVVVQNTDNDTGAGALFHVRAGTTTAGDFLATPALFTPLAGLEANAVHVTVAGGTNGLILVTLLAAPVKIKTNQIERATFGSTGAGLKASAGEQARFNLHTDEANPLELACRVMGAAVAADRFCEIQSIEQGVANRRLALNPAGAEVSVGGDLRLADGITTVDGAIRFDRTAEDLSIGDGAVSRIIHMGAWKAWTTVFGGFSVNPTVNSTRFTKVGKMCTVHFNVNNGTSNATTFTITLPFAAANTSKQHIPMALVTDNGISEDNAGMLRTNVNSITADIFRNGAGLAWTASGSKKTQGTFTYETV